MYGYNECGKSGDGDFFAHICFGCDQFRRRDCDIRSGGNSLRRDVYLYIFQRGFCDFNRRGKRWIYFYRLVREWLFRDGHMRGDYGCRENRDGDVCADDI